MLCALAVGVMLCAAGCSSLSPSVTVKARKFDDFVRNQVETDSENPVSVMQRYRRDFDSHTAPDGLKDLNDEELQVLFDSAALAYWYGGAGTIPEVEGSFRELVHRDAAREADVSAIFHIYMAERDFGKAANVKNLLPDSDMEIVPSLVDTVLESNTLPTELVVDPVSQTVTRRPVDLGMDVGIVIIWHPKCHFSTRALADIRSDKELASIIFPRAKWVAPAGTHLDFTSIQSWNASNSDVSVTIAHRQKEWPMIDYWGSPSFYFIKDGKVGARVVGWPREGRKAEVLAAAKAVGISAD